MLVSKKYTRKTFLVLDFKGNLYSRKKKTIQKKLSQKYLNYCL